jgi:hypothetical protein
VGGDVNYGNEGRNYAVPAEPEFNWAPDNGGYDPDTSPTEQDVWDFMYPE